MILLLLLGPTAMPFRTGWTSRDLFRIGVGGGCKSAIVESKDPMVLTGKHHATASVLKAVWVINIFSRLSRHVELLVE